MQIGQVVSWLVRQKIGTAYLDVRQAGFQLGILVYCNIVKILGLLVLKYAPYVLVYLDAIKHSWFTGKEDWHSYCSRVKIFCIITHWQTGHFQVPLSPFSLKYDSKSKHCKCLHSWPRAGTSIRFVLIGHLKDILTAEEGSDGLDPELGALGVVPVAPISVGEPLASGSDVVLGLVSTGLTLEVKELKFFFTLATQLSMGSNLFFNRPWITDFTVGLWTSCKMNKWDWKIRDNYSTLELFLSTKIPLPGTYTTTCWHSNLYCVPATRTDFF